MNLFKLLFILLTFANTYAEVPHGLLAKNDQFKPVIKLSMKVEGDNYNKLSSCTGTFIHKDYILTAGHCLSSDNGNQDFLRNQNNILINEEKTSRVIETHVSKKYIECLIDYNWSEKTKANLCHQYDIALIKVIPKPGDHSYQISYESLVIDDQFTIVGFGLDITPIEKDFIEDSSFRDRNNKFKEEQRYYKKKVSEAYFFTKWYYEGLEKHYSQSILPYDHKYAVSRSSNKKVKRYGTNKISDVQENLYISQSSNFFNSADQKGFKSGGSHGDSGGPILHKENETYKVYGVMSSAYPLYEYQKNEDTNLSSYANRDFIESIIK